MKTKASKLVLLLLLMASITACAKKAEEPQDPCAVNGHKWMENTPNYEQPKTCEVCGATEGEPLKAPEETEPEATEAASESGNVEEKKDGYLEDQVISTGFISLTVPDEFKGKFYATVDGEMISIFDKACVDDGFPGFVFSVAVDKNKELTPGGMYTKVGEFYTADGESYDVCRGYASEAQWDMEKYEDVPETYDKLEKAADTIIEGIAGIDGGTFVYKGGTKGEDLYFYLLSKYVDAYNEGWDAAKYEEEGMSPEFSAMIKTEGEKALDKIGYAYRDITNDGIDELLVGVISDSDEPSVVYDVYTMVDRSPVSALSGTARNGYYALQYGGIANFYSGGAGENGIYSYIIEPNSTELTLQYGLKCDTYTDEKNPWFICYNEEEWEAMSEEDYNSRYDTLKENFLKLDFTPLSEITPIDYSKVDLSKYATFTKMLDDFKKGMGYANVKLGDTDVFLASTGTFTGENNTENAMDSSVFMYSDGKIVYLGTVSSIGTAYPLSIADGCIFTGGHHNVKKTTVEDGKLVTVEEAEETFDADGNATYSFGNDKDGLKTVEDDSNLTRLFDEYGKAEPIAFSVEKR